MIQEHFLGQRRALAQAQKFQNPVLFACEVNRLAIDVGDFCIEIDG
jgi:hypothetical protein